MVSWPGLGWSASRGQRRLRGQGFSGGAEARQIDLERGAFAGFAVQPDVAFALLDDAVHRGQSEPGALQSLGGVEGLEDVGLGIGVHAHAGVADGEHDVVAGLHRGMEAGVVGVEGDVGGLDGQLPAVRHGIAGVDRQVHDDLLDLSGIGLDRADVRARHHDQIDVFADQPGQHFHVFRDHAVQVNDLGSQHLLAAEGQQLAGE